MTHLITYKRTDSTDPDFHKLIGELDRDLTIRNGAEQAKFAEFNTVDKIKCVIIAYQNSTPVGCGGFKNTTEQAEIKRMYVNATLRGQHIGEKILVELETWAQELGFKSAILETGVNQTEAQNLYKKLGYTITPNYGPYLNFADSICMKKIFK
ncbi:MAG: GNAT family N-acetyltransferase [Salinivirgaceae bacterium]|jgi:ribosomal protein S18 acetylase RimI-like enzyme